jgi:outer membrane protein assembly factor BamB
VGEGGEVIALLLALCLQPEAEADRQVAKLRGTPAERRDATDALIKLKKRDKKVRDRLSELLKKEEDPRVQARLEYVLAAVWLESLWNMPLEQNTYVFATATRDRVVVASQQGRVVSLRARDGSTAWTHELNDALYSAPVVAGDEVHVAAYKAKALLRLRADGAKVKATGRPMEISGIQRVTCDGTYLVYPAAQNRLRCEKLADGKGVEIAGAIAGYATAVAEGRVFFVDAQGRVTCADAAKGSIVWQEGRGTWIVGADATRVVVVDTSGTAKSYAVDTGKELWSVSTPDAVRKAVVAGAIVGRRVLIPDYLGTITALDVATGRVAWERRGEANRGWMGGAYAIVGDTIAVPDGGAVAILDLETGRELARKGVDEQAVTGLGACGDRLYAVSYDHVYAFEVSR